jgi:hypothetical protein
MNGGTPKPVAANVYAPVVANKSLNVSLRVRKSNLTVKSVENPALK